MFRNVVLFPSKLGQPIYGLDKTPEVLRFFLSSKNMFYPIKCNNKIDKNLFNLYSKLTLIRSQKVIIGGDHSMSIATVADSLNRNPNTKVIWIDAHADINTPESSLTNNIHGMSLSFLTGLINQNRILEYTFIKNKLDFNNLLYIGLRDTDIFEKQILREKNIDVITVNELENNLSNSLQKVENFISGEDVHISFDVDCLDPSVMPCTGTKYQNGITVNTAKLLMDSLRNEKIRNLDITELNLDIGCKNDKVTSLQNLFYIFENYLD